MSAATFFRWSYNLQIDSLHVYLVKIIIQYKKLVQNHVIYLLFYTIQIEKVHGYTSNIEYM